MAGRAGTERERLLAVADRLVEEQRWREALVEYERLLVADPRDVRVLLKLGDLHLHLQAYGDALAVYERVGELYALQGLTPKAIAVYRQVRQILELHAPELELRFGTTATRLADLYISSGQLAEAFATLLEAGGRQEQVGRDERALALYERARDLDPQNPLAHVRIGEAMARLGRAEEAFAALDKAAARLQALGRADDALRVYERLLSARPDVAAARRAAEAHLERGGPEDGRAALAKLQLAVKLDPRDLATLAVLARTFDHLDQSDKAVEVEKEAARIAYERGETAVFEELVRGLLRRAPRDPEVQSLAGVEVFEEEVDAVEVEPLVPTAPSPELKPLAPPPPPQHWAPASQRGQRVPPQPEMFELDPDELEELPPSALGAFASAPAYASGAGYVAGAGREEEARGEARAPAAPEPPSDDDEGLISLGTLSLPPPPPEEDEPPADLPSLESFELSFDDLLGAPAPSTSASAAAPASAFEAPAVLDTARSPEAPGRAAPTPAPAAAPGSTGAPESPFDLPFVSGPADAPPSAAEAASSYDLALANKALGRMQEAFDALLKAALHPARECLSWSTLGLWKVELGDPGGAIAAFKRAALAPSCTLEQAVSIAYELGELYASTGSLSARPCFELVVRLRPNHDDPRGSGEERLERLGAERSPTAPRPWLAPDPQAEEFDVPFSEALRGAMRAEG